MKYNFDKLKSLKTIKYGTIHKFLKQKTLVKYRQICYDIDKCFFVTIETYLY